MIPETEPEIKRNDTTPSVIDQAKTKGWESGIYSFGNKPSDGLTYFNAGIVQRPDGKWLLARRSENAPTMIFGYNSIWAIKLSDDGKTAIKGIQLKWTDFDPEQQCEDARAFYVPHLNQVGISACTFKWFKTNSWTGAIQVLGFFDENWNCKVVHYPPYDTNATSLQNIPRERYQKNWLFWMRDDRLHLLYKSDPWTVAEFGGNWQEQRTHANEGAKWPHGEIRGGTPPVLIGDKYYTFFHSSTAWRGNYRRYYVGAIAFSAQAPFEIVAMTKEPILIGSQKSKWEMRKPPCVFPCGAIYENDSWLITYGLNDLEAGWISIPHADILKRLMIEQSSFTPMVEIPSAQVPERILGKSALLIADDSEPFVDPKREAMLARLVKARATAAANREKKRLAALA